MRRVHCVLALVTITFFAAGCGADKSSSKESRAHSDSGARSAPTVARPPEAASRDRDTGKELALAEAVAGTDTPARSRHEPGRQSGLLTAGSFDDNIEPGFYRSFARRLGQHWEVGAGLSRFSGRRLTILVKGSDGGPVGNARVRLSTVAGNERIITTRSDGRAVFVAPWDPMGGSSVHVTVTPPDGSTSVGQVVPPDASRWEITLPSVTSMLPNRLDLAIVLDTTGSMGDELEFLKTELKSIVETVKQRYPQVDQEFALILYRDDGDAYVTRTFDFTPSFESFRQNLSNQQAGGGGDEPEALHRALDDAGRLHWVDDHSARVLFLLTDAPPHRQHLESTMHAANVLRDKGVAIYPIACSGYSPAAEFVLRTCAMLTGSEFIFLTDDSGVGNSHAEPHIPYYHVQKLEKMMIRMIEAELAGKRLVPEKGDILRTVGKPIN